MSASERCATVEKFGKLDVVVNMAGVITPVKPVVSLSDQDFDFTFDVNVRGLMICLRVQLNAMSALGGSIVSIAYCRLV